MSGEGIFKSTNGGDTWAAASTTIFGTRLRLAMAPSDPLILYALSSSDTLHRTSDGAANWTQVNSNSCGGQCTYNLILDVHPTNPDMVLVAPSLGHFHERRPTSPSWTTAGAARQKVHRTSTRALPRDPTARIGGAGGLWSTDNGGPTHQPQQRPELTQFYDEP